ncbi:MAG: hypothetical protein CVT60_06675, partial [Actinobacteria bacterium HGW-Actinobacteria-10]
MPDGTEIRFFRDSVAGRRGEILDAATTVFYRRGYDAGTMREIAEAVGVSEPALYRHFTGKEDLFDEIIRQAGARVRSEVVPAIESAGPTEVRRVIRELVADRRTVTTTYLPVIQTVMLASVHNEHFLSVYRDSFTTPLTDRLLGVVRALDEHFGVAVPEQEL